MTLCDVLPGSTSNDGLYASSRKSKIGPDLPVSKSRVAARPYLSNLVLCNYRSAAFLPLGAPPSTLGLHVEKVVMLRPNEQMVGVNAPTVVALVADEQTERDLSVSHLPRQTVGIKDRLPSALPYHSVSITSGSFPLPTTVIRSTQYLGPEAFRRASRLSRHMVINTTENT